MGYFSWIAQDTNESVKIDKNNKPICVYYLWDNDGNKWKESAYEGVGVFGGKDFFVLLYEMNTHGISKKELKEKISAAELRVLEDVDNEDEEFFEMREKGIEMYYSNDPNILYPNITETTSWKWHNEKPKDDPNQGWW